MPPLKGAVVGFYMQASAVSQFNISNATYVDITYN